MPPTVQQAMEKAFQVWYTTAANFTVGIIKRNWLQGPRPTKLGVLTGSLRSRIDSQIFPDGFAVGTKAKHGVYWEKGISARTIVPVKRRALKIPIRGTTKGRRKGPHIFRKKAFVPAQTPRKWLEPGIKQATPGVITMGNKVLGEALRMSFQNRIVGK